MAEESNPNHQGRRKLSLRVSESSVEPISRLKIQVYEIFEKGKLGDTIIHARTYATPYNGHILLRSDQPLHSKDHQNTLIGPWGCF